MIIIILRLILFKIKTIYVNLKLKSKLFFLPQIFFIKIFESDKIQDLKLKSIIKLK